MRSILFALVAFFLGCSSSTEPDRVRVLGVIAGYQQNDPQIEIVAGENRSALVRVTTYGGGCHSKGETEVVVQGMEAVITPHDYTAPPGTPCTRILSALTHEAVVHFGSAGTARVLVRGIDMSRASAANLDGGVITVERTVEIP